MKLALPTARRPTQALDTTALADAYLALNRPLFAYAYRLLGDACEAEDVVGEAFRRLLATLSHGDSPVSNVSAYLYRTVHNLAADQWRRRAPMVVPLSDACAAPQESDPAAALADGAAAARAALWRLTPDQRQVVLLKFFEGLDNAEVAATLHKPVGAVKSLQHRALEALRRMLAAEATEGVG